MIALLCPTKARPEKCKRMIESAYATSTTDLRVYLAVSAEDFDQYLAMAKAINKEIILITVPEPLPTVQKWNDLAILALTEKLDSQQVAHNLFMLAGDDMIFDTPGWDKSLIDHYKGLDNKIHIYHLQDSRDEDGTPHPIMTREYIEAMGYFIPPIFLHWQIDVWTVGIAKANNCFTHLKNCKLIHDKDSDIGKPDKTHTGIRNYGWRQRDEYVAKSCKHFLELEKQRLKRAIWDSNLKRGWKANEYEDCA